MYKYKFTKVFKQLQFIRYLEKLQYYYYYYFLYKSFHLTVQLLYFNKIEKTFNINFFHILLKLETFSTINYIIMIEWAQQFHKLIYILIFITFAANNFRKIVKNFRN